MKKLLLGSLVLLIFSASITLFNISCKKESNAQPSQSNCANTATVIFTVNFPSDAAPRLGRASDNGIYLESESNSIIDGAQDLYETHSYFQSFSNVGNTSKKVFTFKNIVPAEFQYGAEIFGTSVNWIVKSTTSKTLKVEAGKTYDITINSSDFK